MARPSSYDPEFIPTVIEMALEGETDDVIADKLGVARSTLALWKIKHPEFSDALKAAKGAADDAVELSLYRKALTGDTTACIFWLKNRRSKEWRDVARTIVSGDRDNPLVVEGYDKLSTTTLREIASLGLSAAKAPEDA